MSEYIELEKLSGRSDADYFKDRRKFLWDPERVLLPFRTTIVFFVG